MTAQALSIYSLWGATALYVIALVGYSLHSARAAEARGAGAEAPTGSKALGIARSTTIVGAALHLIGVVARGVEAGHAPWSSMYEYAITGSFVAVAALLVLGRRRDATFLGAGVIGIAALALGLALPLLYDEATTLQPALKSFWLIIHVGIAITATGIFTVAFVVTVLQLVRLRRDRRAAAGDANGKALRFVDNVPEPRELEALAFRLNAFGFVLWTFTVIAGAIWAHEAWTRFWGWDPKEVWSLVIWLIYAAYLHARTTSGWSGRAAGFLAIAGFVALILNFTVVNLVFTGLHTYATP